MALSYRIRMMNEWDGMELLERLAEDDLVSDERPGHRLPKDVRGMAHVLAAVDRLDDGDPVEGESAAIKAVLLYMHARLERAERDLLRHLKFDSETSRTWEEVAAEFGDMYGGRAAVFNRWKRLTDDQRRTPSMDMRRGAAIRRAADVVESTTTEQDA